MCGFCGYVGEHAPELLGVMNDVIAHRGPDDAGTWYDENMRVGLGHRRLSIIDLSSAGHQPMSNEDDTVWIAFNGEIYDHQTHRDLLVERGHTFRSNTDTEVLVHLYEEHGVGMLEHLNGMFSFALWDSKERQLLLARDHAGIKPLYYRVDGERMFFASEMKALLRVPGVTRDLDLDSLHQYLTFLWVPGRNTMLQGISKLEPGHYLTWKNGRIKVRQWFSLPYEPDDSLTEDVAAELVHDTFMRTTRRQMVSDVPLGAFLSGGADSSAIVACMRHSFPDQEIRCYTARNPDQGRFDQQNESDYPYAVKVAERLGVQLRSLDIEPHLVSLLPKMIYHLDEPDADPAVFPSYLISKAAREEGTLVLLSGTGGDEVFLGYRVHLAQSQVDLMNPFPRWLFDLPLKSAASISRGLLGARSSVSRRIKKVHEMLMTDGLERYLALADWSSPQARRAIYSADLVSSLPEQEAPAECMQRYFEAFEGQGELNLHSHMMLQGFLAAHNLNYTDKTSMATSIEVRVPFLDLELMRLAARIPERVKLKGRVTKSLFKKSMEPHLGRDVLYRSKTGFGPSIATWVSSGMDELIGDLLSEQRLRSRGLFDHKAVQAVLNQNKSDAADHSNLIYGLLNLELWQQTFMDRPGELVSL